MIEKKTSVDIGGLLQEKNLLEQELGRISLLPEITPRITRERILDLKKAPSARLKEVNNLLDNSTTL